MNSDAAATSPNVTAPLSSPRCRPGCEPTDFSTNIADIRRTAYGAIPHVRGKGNKGRRIPIEPPLINILEAYLTTRRARFPTSTRRRSPRKGLPGGRRTHHCSWEQRASASSAAPCNIALSVPSREPESTANVYAEPSCSGLRHIFATELAQSDVSVYALMSLLGHESMSTSQRYVTAAGVEGTVRLTV